MRKGVPVEQEVETCHNASRHGEKDTTGMSLVIPDEVLHSARMSAAELSQEVAILLFQKDKLTLGQAS